MGKRSRFWISMILTLSLVLPICPTAVRAEDDGLLLHYDFESIEDNKIADKSGNGFHGTLKGEGELHSGAIGYGLNIDGGGYVQIPAAVIKDLGDMTITGEVHISALTEGDNVTHPTTMFAAGVGNRNYSYAMINSQSFNFGNFHEGYGYTIKTASFAEKRMAAGWDVHPNLQEWNTFAVVQEGTTVRQYLNGVLVREDTGITATLGDVYVDENTAVYLGKPVWEDYVTKGTYDNFKIYNKALSAEELPQNDLVLAYDFDAVAEGVIEDKSGNNYDGTLVGNEDSFDTGVVGDGFSTTGGAYIQIPAAVIKDLKDMTIAGQVYITSLTEGDNVTHPTTMFAAGVGNRNSSYAMINSQSFNFGNFHEGYGYTVKTASFAEKRMAAGWDTHPEQGSWNTFAVVQEGTTVRQYLNGELVREDTGITATLGDVYVDENTAVYLGKSVWEDYLTQGVFDNFRIYSRALSADELQGRIDVEMPVEETPFTQTVDYIERAVDFLINDGNALPVPKDEQFKAEWSVVSGDAVITDGKLCKTETSLERQPVVLQAVVTGAEGESETLTFEHVTLIDPYAGYILSFFGVQTDAGTGSSAENFRIAYSYDGLHWATLNNNEPIVYPTLGTTRRVRDPYIMRNKDGSFTLMSTQGWDTPYIYLWHSDNLTEFDNERLLFAATKTAGETGARAWAPEGMYDPITDQYYIYWSDPSGTSGKGVTYYNTSKDLETLSDSGVFFNPGYRHLDANIVKHDGSYYMDFRHYTEYNALGKSGIRMASASELAPGAFTCYTEDVNPFRSDSASEGSFLFKVNGEDKWYLYWDYNDIYKFGVMETTDLASGEWTYLGINEHMPHSVVRHGGSMPVTQKELDAIIAKWNPNGETITIAEVAEQEPVTAAGTTAFAELALPETAEVILNNGKRAECAVVWSEEEFAEGVPGEQILSGTLTVGEGFTNPKEIKAEITVTVIIEKTELQNLYDTWIDSLQDDYTDESWTVLQEELKEAEAVLADEGATQQAVLDETAALSAAVSSLITNLQVAKQDAIEELTSYKDPLEYREAQRSELEAGIADGAAAIEAAQSYEEIDAALTAAKEELNAIKTDVQLSTEEERAAAEAAKEAAREAQAAAEAAEEAAKEAQAKAEAAQAAAKEAEEAAAEAEKDAGEEKEAAEEAKAAAEEARAKAETAQAQAQAAAEQAEAAQKAAEEAQAAAEAGSKEAAQEAAEAAKEAANAAEEAANAAEYSELAAKYAAEAAKAQAAAQAAQKAAEEAKEEAEAAAKLAMAKHNAFIAITTAMGGIDADKLSPSQFEAYKETISEATQAVEAAETEEELIAVSEEFRQAMEELEEEIAQRRFEDVYEADWFYDSVDYVAFKGYMLGMSERIFGPYEKLSRGQFALILYRMEGAPEFETEKAFEDIEGDEWYAQAVLWAAENGIVIGYDNGCFGPADLITREQMALMMYRYAVYLGGDTSKTIDYSSYEDAECVSIFAETAMGWAVGNGIITGKEDATLLAPQGCTARSEAAVIMYRFSEKYGI